MFPWFQLLILWIIWKAFEDFWMEQLGDAEDAIREKLQSLTAGEQLGTSPLVKVLAVDTAADTVTILVREATEADVDAIDAQATATRLASQYSNATFPGR